MANQPPANGGVESISAAFLTSPQQTIAPMWVGASGVSPAARSLVEPLIAGAMHVHGDEAPVLDREMLAWWADGRRPDKVGALLGELVAIGFLVIYDGGCDSKGRRQKRRDPQTNRALPDVYAVRLEPPAGYRGPRNLTEAREWFRADRESAYAAHSSSGRRARPGQVRVDRQIKGHLVESEFSQVNPSPSPQGPAPDSGPSQQGPAQFSQVNPSPSPQGPYVGDTSGISGGEIPEVGSAPPPASAGADDAAPEELDWARLLVRALPWRSKGRGPTTQEADQLAASFRTAQFRNGLSQNEIREHALNKLGRADAEKNPISYVIGAFKAEHLDRLRPAGDYEPLADQALSLPETAGKANAKPPSNASHLAPVDASAIGEAELPEWCGMCNAGGEPARGNSRLRYVEESSGREMCTCHPQHPSRKTA